MAAGLHSPAAPASAPSDLTRIRRPSPVDAGMGAAGASVTRLAGVYPVLLTASILAGFGLRLFLLDRFPLREDEAIYAFWARYGREVDWLFLQVWPDKPPLFLAALALAFESWGASPAAARFVNIAASLLTIPVVAAAARRWWGPCAGMAAALALSLSPFAVSFAPTVYTDPLLVLAGSLALCAAVYRRPFWAGLWLAAAIMTKQQGLLYVPLVIAVLGVGLTQRRKDAKVFEKDSLTQSRRDTEKRRDYPNETPQFLLCEPLRLRAAASRFSAPLRAALLFLSGLLLVAGPVLWWDSLRWAVAPSPWDLGAQNVGALTMLPPAQWPGRAADWLALAWQLQASWPVWLVWGGLIASAAVLAARRRTRTVDQPAWLLLGWAFAFLTLHIVTSVQVWDRYLLPLAPVLALLVGWGVAAVGSSQFWLTQRRKDAKTRLGFYAVLASVAILLLALPAIAAADGRLPVGADHGAYAGLEDALALITQPITNLQSPNLSISPAPRTVLYHSNLGWQAQFYLFDAIAAGRVDLRWIPSATALADNAAKTPHLRRYLVEADWAPVRDLTLQIAARRLQLEPVLRRGHFTVYAITARLPAAAADWRVCAPPAPWPVWEGARGGAATGEGRHE